MKTGLLQHLQLSDVPKAKQLVDESRVRACSNPTTGIFEVINETHPASKIITPCDFHTRRPVEVIGAMKPRVRLKETHQSRQRIVLVPLSVSLTHDISVGFVDGKCWYEGEVKIEQLVDGCLPRLAAAFS